jgi:hypothetical protein
MLEEIKKLRKEYQNNEIKATLYVMTLIFVLSLLLHSNLKH